MDLTRSNSVRPTIEILLAAHSPNDNYTTSSAIDGVVSLRAHEDFKLQNVQISLVGYARKSLELDRICGQTRREWCLLKTHMPMDDCRFIESDIYTFRQHHEMLFHFRVPRRLPVGTCSHGGIDAYLQEQHLSLPPTLGIDGADDMCPDLISVNYYIEVRSSYSARETQRGGNLHKRLPIMILPEIPEEAPMDLDSQVTNFSPSAALSMRRNMIGRVVAHMWMKAHQPASIMLSPNQSSPSDTAVYITLAFESSAGTLHPPGVKHVHGKITSNTYFGPNILHEWPQRDIEGSGDIQPLLNYKVDTSVIDHSPGELDWVADGSSTGAIHRTTLRIPFGICCSGSKSFLPTFHCCLFSRTYVLAIKLSLSETQTMKVTVPLQIGVKASHPTSHTTDVRSVGSPEPPRYDSHPTGQLQQGPGLGESRSW